jgi:hypothetical protein
MPLKIENATTFNPLPHSMMDSLNTMVRIVPPTHLRGLERLVIVNYIRNPHLKGASAEQLPGLYHPKQGARAAWLEISLNALLPQGSSIFRRVVAKMSFKSNLAAVLFSLIGQHYYITLRHSIKRTQLEPAVRAYALDHVTKWSAERHKFRAKLFKPLKPLLERWAKSLQKNVRKNAREQNNR